MSNVPKGGGTIENGHCSLVGESFDQGLIIAWKMFGIVPRIGEGFENSGDAMVERSGI